MPEDELHPQAPDPTALQRRVLVAAAVSLATWVAVLVVLDALHLGPWYAVLSAVLVYAVVVRPLMRPVRAAVALRRRLAYRAWTGREDDA